MADEYKNEVEDLYQEHSQHSELMPDRCSECFKEDQALTQEKRVEEAEQADRAELEDLNEEESNENI